MALPPGLSPEVVFPESSHVSKQPLGWYSGEASHFAVDVPSVFQNVARQVTLGLFSAPLERDCLLSWASIWKMLPQLLLVSCVIVVHNKLYL